MYLWAKPTHVMCLADPAEMPESVGVISEADKKTILDLHNKARSGVKPPATNMYKMVSEIILTKS